MAGPPMKIVFIQNAEDYIPLKITTAKQFHLHEEDQSEEVLTKIQNLGIIEPEPSVTKWCSPSMMVPKSNGRGIRLVTDFRSLNPYVSHPIHTFPSVKDIVQSVPNESKVFCTLDCKIGYFQIENRMAEESRALITLNKARGKFRYCRAPMGLCSSNDKICPRTDAVLCGIKNVMNIVNDILISGGNEDEVLQKVEEVLRRCEKNNIT
uniref:Putative LOC100889457 [Strongylocentrotus purpuratus] n=1 Tax=Lepeophtheirus salmonis TaxID=72036 RepID=A0A0K2T2Q8_LEPSM